MAICEKCGEEKILAEQAVTGFPDHHVAGTRKKYCGYCDEPPVFILTTGIGKIFLVPNETQ